MNTLYLVLAGIMIGGGMIIPGVSGGVLAVILGIYERIISIIAHPFEDLRENIKFGLPLAAGAVISVLALSQVLNYLLEYYPLLVKYLFIGLLAGSLPGLTDVANAKGLDKRYYAALILGVCIIFIPLLFGSELQEPVKTADELKGWQAVLSGILLAAGTVVPGVSSSFLLMIAGTYQLLLKSLAQLNLLPLIPTGLSALISAVLLSRVTKFLLSKYYGWTYYTLLGIVAGSIIVVFPGFPRSILEALLGILLLVFGALVSWRLSRRK